MSVYIIAEAGVNHNGDFDKAKELVVTAKKIGANAIKFQTFKSDSLTIENSPLANYQRKTLNLGNQHQMLKRLELSYEDFKELKNYAKKTGIDFISTAFDLESLDFLNSIGQKIWKVPSGEITNLPFLRKLSQIANNVILSTGMSTLEEVKTAFNLISKNVEKISILHCTSEYPAPLKDVNLRVIEKFRELFKVDIGYSDHTEGITVPLSAVALGATIIEKHFTLDKNAEGPDHKSSLNPNEFRSMIMAIRDLEIALGSSEKVVTPSEQNNRDIVRKSIVASKPIKKGEIFSELNLTTKRPGYGISPMGWDEVIGKKARKNFDKDDFISL